MKFRLLILILIILTPIVTAYTLETEGIPGSICPRETGIYKIKLKNTDNYQRQFLIQLTEAGANFAKIIPNNPILQPNQETTLLLYITPKQNSVSGNYAIRISVNSNTETQYLDYNFNVKNCYNSIITASETKIESCQSEQVSYPISITNLGQYDDTYDLVLQSDIDIVLPKKILEIKPSKSEIFNINVETPIREGEYNITLKAKSQKTKIENKIDLILKTKPCYQFDFLYPKENELNICAGSINQIRYGIKNNGTVPEEYNLNLKSQKWITSQQEVISLQPQELKYFDITINPEYKDYGSFKSELEIVPKNGDKKIQTQFVVNVRHCQNVQLLPQYESLDICQGENKTLKISLLNNGELTNAYITQLELPAWVYGTIPITNLKPKQQKDSLLVLSPGIKNKPGDYYLKINTTSIGGSEEVAIDSKQVKIKLEDAIKCYSPTLKSNYENIIIYYDDSVAIPVTIKNSGKKPITYTLMINGSGSEFTLLNKNSITLEPEQSEKIFLYVSPKIDSNLTTYNLVLDSYSNDVKLLSNNFIFKLTDNKEEATKILQTENNEYFVIPKIIKNKVIVITTLLLLLILIAAFKFKWHKKITANSKNKDTNADIKPLN